MAIFYACQLDMNRKVRFSMQIPMDVPAEILPLQRLSPERFETSAILKKLASASRKLAELK